MSLMQLLLGTAAAVPTSGIVTSGLVMHLDAGNASSYPGSGTAWTDLTVNGNNGTLTNGPTYSAADGGQIVFDGTNDFTAIAGSSSLAFNTGDFTLECWFKLTSVTTDYEYIYSIAYGASAHQEYSLRFGEIGFDDRLQFAVNASGTGSTYSFPEKKSTLSGVWLQFVHTRESGSNKAFINGAARNFNSGIAPTTYPLSSFSDSAGSSTQFASSLARSQTLLGFYAPINIPIYRAYNRALSASEVTQNFNANRARFGL
jgi:hypothetical protein